MKKTFINLILVLSIVLSFNNTATAVIAYPKPIVYIQPDGTRLTVVMQGDEFLKWASTPDGYTLMYNNNGFLEYAIKNSNGDMIPSGIIATDYANRNLQARILLNNSPKNLFYSDAQLGIVKQIKNIRRQEMVNTRAFPTTGAPKLICILIGYTDLAFTKTQVEFNNLYNQVGYSTGGATGSVKDYYLENSYNQFNLTVDVAGPYTASNSMSYYGQNLSGNDRRPRELVTEAINLADPDVDFSEYDNDNDDAVDGVYIIYAGYGEEAGGGDDAIWAHAWYLSSPLLKDGVYLQRYSCSAELRGNSGSDITNIGVICHEFGHVLGAPDYYDTDYATGGQFSGTGQWDIMAGGSWNNEGATPPHHNGFTKTVYYNWAVPTTIYSASTISLSNAEENSNSFYRYYTTTSGEYYFFENRTQHKFDAYIPGSGLIIYHVAASVLTAGASNNINDTYPQLMYPVAQNATTNPGSTAASYGTINSATCAWTGATGTKTSFTDYTIPSAKSWAGNNSGKPITNISYSAGLKTVTFDIMGGAPGKPVNFTATPISASQINLAWQQNTALDNVMIAVSTDGTFGIPEDGTPYVAGNTITGGGNILYNGSALAYNNVSLNEQTTYYYKAWSVFTGDNYSYGVTTDATTLCYPKTLMPFTENFDASTNCPGCWQVIDNQGSGQVWQFGTFTGGVSGTTGNYAYVNSDGYGSGNTQNTDLISPTFDFSGYTNINLSFKHYFKYYSGSSARVYYSLNNGSTWTQIQQWTGDITNPTTFSLTISALANQSQVKFKWNYTGSWGWYWSIDDIQIAATASNSLTVDNTTQILDANMAYQNVTVKGDGKLTVSPDKILSVTGNFIIESDASGTGSFIQGGLLRVTGNTTVQKYLPNTTTSGWTLSVPVTTADASVFSGADALYFYNSATPGWEQQTVGTLNQMTGYVSRFSTTQTIQFSGDLNNNTLSRTNLIRNPNNYGWNYVGNPYPSPIDWNASPGITRSNLNNAVYYRMSNGLLAAYVSGVGTNGATSIIPSMQAFWVQVSQGQTTGSIEFTNDARLHGANESYKTNPADFIRIKLSHNNLSDETVVRFLPQASVKFDKTADALKMYDTENMIPNVYSISHDEAYAISSLPTLTTFTSVPLGIVTTNSGIHTLAFDDVTSFQSPVDIILEDTYTETFTNILSTSTYAFDAHTGNCSDRFILHFQPAAATTPDTDAHQMASIYTYAKTVYVSGIDNDNCLLSIYTITGQEVAKEYLSKSTLQKINTNLSSGQYILNIRGPQINITQKVVLM